MSNERRALVQTADGPCWVTEIAGRLVLTDPPGGTTVIVYVVYQDQYGGDYSAPMAVYGNLAAAKAYAEQALGPTARPAAWEPYDDGTWELASMIVAPMPVLGTLEPQEGQR